MKRSSWQRTLRGKRSKLNSSVSALPRLCVTKLEAEKFKIYVIVVLKKLPSDDP